MFPPQGILPGPGSELLKLGVNGRIKSPVQNRTGDFSVSPMPDAPLSLRRPDGSEPEKILPSSCRSQVFPLLSAVTAALPVSPGGYGPATVSRIAIVLYERCASSYSSFRIA